MPLGMDSAFSNSLPAHADGLTRYARAITRNPADADDLVQECFRRALNYARSGRPIENVRAYLFAILANIHKDELARRRRRGIAVPIETEESHLACPPQQHARLECNDVSRALDTLPERQKQVLLLIGLYGESYEKAAAILDIPIGTVMSRLSRGRQALRQVMAE